MSEQNTQQISGATASSGSLIKRQVVGVLLINLFVVGLVAFSLSRSHNSYRERAETTARNLNSVLSQNFASTIDKVDLGLLLAVDEVERQLVAGKPDSAALAKFLTRLQGRLPWVIGIRATDEKGMVKYGVDVPKGARVDLSDREYYIRLRDDPSSGLFINKPVMSRINKVWVINFARRLNHADGRFAGVVFANISLENIGKNFAGVDVGPHGFINLRDDATAMIVRYPVPQDPESIIGKIDASPEYMKAMATGKPAGSFYASVSFDNTARVVSYQKVDNYPLYVSIGLAQEDYLKEWRREALQMSGLTLLFFLVSVIGLWLVGHSWQRQLDTTNKLAMEEEKFHTVADYTYDWEYWEGVDRKLIYISPSCERITGYGPAEFQADPGLLERIIHPDDRQLMAVHVHDNAHAEEATLDFRIVRRDGDIRWIAHGCQAVFGRDGQFLGRRASNRDITERQQAEAKIHQLNEELEQRVAQRTALLESANKEIEEFSYSISHDLRTPLRAINGFSQILLEEQGARLDEEGRRLLKVVRDNAQRMGGQIDGILSFLRMGKREMEFTNVDIARLAQDVFAGLLATYPARSMRLETGYLPMASGDREMLREVLMNLLSNAVKFSPDGSEAVIELSGLAAETENTYKVKDYGVGFDMQYVDKLFKVFERVHPTGQYEGSGIGLAIVKRIINRHGGRVWAEGKVNEGATVYFTLPTGGSHHE
jgi:PAS domain S-box-containing protein